MDDAWEVLKSAGLPDGAARGRPTDLPNAQQIQSALQTVMEPAGGLDTRRQELLLAWLQGGFHHWPSGFGELVGAVGLACRDQLARQPEIDRDRYLKLRRIAIENLSAVL